MNPVKNEPLLSVAGITAAATAIIALVVSFGLPITPEQQTAILGVVAVIAPLVVTVVRRWVTPNSKLPEQIAGE